MSTIKGTDQAVDVLFGSTDPAATVGDPNDWYLKVTSGNVVSFWEKGEVNWTKRADVGSGSGIALHDGTTAPAGGTGAVGDWYVQRNSSGNVTSLHEKTASTTWTNRGNIPAQVPPFQSGTNFPATDPADGTHFLFTAAQSSFTSGKTVRNAADTANVTAAFKDDLFKFATTGTKWIQVNRGWHPAPGGVTNDAIPPATYIGNRVGTGTTNYRKSAASSAHREIRWNSANTLEIQTGTGNDTDVDDLLQWSKASTKLILVYYSSTVRYLLPVSAVSRTGTTFTLTVGTPKGSAYSTFASIGNSAPIQLYLYTHTYLGFLDRRTTAGALAAGEFRATATQLVMRYTDTDTLDNETVLKAVTVGQYIGVSADGGIGSVFRVTAKSEGTNDITFTGVYEYGSEVQVNGSPKKTFVVMDTIPFALNLIPGTAEEPPALTTQIVWRAGRGLIEDTANSELDVGQGLGIEVTDNAVAARVNGDSIERTTEGLKTREDEDIWTPTTRQTAKQVYNLDFGKGFSSYKKIVFFVDNGSSDEHGNPFVIDRAEWVAKGSTSGRATYWTDNGWISLRWKSNTSFEFLSTSQGVGGLQKAQGRYL